MSGYFKHYGVRGMRWGIRKDKRTASEDHITARTLGRKRLHELSNAELKRYSERIRLEQEYKRLNAGTVAKGKDFISKQGGKLGGKIGEATYQGLANQVAPFLIAAIVGAAKLAYTKYKSGG